MQSGALQSAIVAIGNRGNMTVPVRAAFSRESGGVDGSRAAVHPVSFCGRRHSAVREVTDQKGNGCELTLRDKLAIDRTALANERTLLAYARTSLALLIVGGSLIKFFETPASSLAGRLFLLAAVLLLLVGTARFVTVQRRLKAVAAGVSNQSGTKHTASVIGGEQESED
jgi:putative membrane protein